MTDSIVSQSVKLHLLKMCLTKQQMIQCKNAVADCKKKNKKLRLGWNLRPQITVTLITLIS